MKTKRTITRRDFLKTTAIGAAGMAAGSIGFPAILRAAKEPIIIGHQPDMTGFLASYGYFYDKAVKAAIDQVNSEGGIAGREVKYVMEDSASKADVGVRAFRKLVLKDNADFVLGSVHSGIGIATSPIAKELETPYFPNGMSSAITGAKGNRWVFRSICHARMQVQASANLAFDKIGKDWFIVYMDYAWGHSHRDNFKNIIEGLGGNIIGTVATPIGTKDFMPYLTKLPPGTNAIYYATLGADTVGFLRQIREIGYNGEKFSVICPLDGVDVAKLGEIVEGDWILEYLPRTLADYDTAYHKAFREAIGIDEFGYEKGTGKPVTGSHYWSNYENVFIIKGAIEKSGWKNRKDHSKFVETLEGMRFREGPGFPQGDLVMRAEDHQGFHQHWMSRVEDGKLRVKYTIPIERVMYPATVDFTREAL